MSEPLEQEFEIEHLEAFRFLVSSRSRAGTKHLVDLQSNKGNGQCGCEDYRCNRGPDFVLGHRGARITCKHISACDRWLRMHAVLTFQNGKPHE